MLIRDVVGRKTISVLIEVPSGPIAKDCEIRSGRHSVTHSLLWATTIQLPVQ